MSAKAKKNSFRWTNNISLALTSLAACGLTLLLDTQNKELSENISLGTGYIALLFLVVTLLLGLVNMRKVRKNPVNLNLRRDVGIWSGITALVHTFFSFQIYFGGNLVLYFLQEDESGLKFQPNLFHASNIVGLVATIIIFVLLITSNNLSLKLMKGKAWKNLQRFNYLLFVLTIAHTFTQQFYQERTVMLVYAVIGLTVVTLLGQLAGFLIYQHRERARMSKVAPTLASPEVNSVGNDSAVMRRRKLLAVAGATLVTGFAGGVVFRPLLFQQRTEMVAQAGVSLPQTPVPVVNIPTTGTTGVAVNIPSSPTGTATELPVTSNAVTTATAPATTPAARARITATPQPVTTAPATNTSPSNAPVTTPGAAGAKPSPVASTTAASSRTVVLASLANFPVGNVQQFADPITNKRAFLVHEEDGSIKAFSGICTHEPFNLTYAASQKQLYCSKHAVYFDTVNGKPNRNPGRIALPTLKVEVTAQGNIVYNLA